MEFQQIVLPVTGYVLEHYSVNTRVAQVFVRSAKLIVTAIQIFTITQQNKHLWTILTDLKSDKSTRCEYA